MIRTLLAIPAALMLAAPAVAQDAPDGLVAHVASPDGTDMGSVAAAPTESGVMLLTVFLKGLEPGIRAIHIHETGSCEGPDFASAGGHLANGHDHGIHAETGPHPGDLPNIHVPDSGEVRLELFAPGVTAEMLTDSDGAAFVVHAQADDYTGQPAGNAGDRIGCGVFGPAQ